MSASHHIEPREYAERLRNGTNTRDEDQHVAGCDVCRAAVEGYVARDKQQWQHDVFGAFLHYTTEMARSTFALVLPPLKKALRPERTESVARTQLPPEPLRVFLPQSFRWIQKPQVKFVAIVLFTLLVLLLPAPAGLTGSAHRAIVVFIFTAGILTLQPVSLPLAALMIPVAQIFLGVANASQSFEPFSRPVVFLILASLFRAQALGKHRITRRLALQTIIASNGNVRKLLLGLMAISALLSMWVENTGTAAVLIPVALTISREVKDKDQARSLLVLLVLGIAYSASLGGMVTIMGAASNAVASGFLEEIRPWSFLDWSKYGLPPFLVIFPITWWLLLRMVPVSVDQIEVGGVEEGSKQMGAMSKKEKELIVTMCLAGLFWIFGAVIEDYLNLPDTIFSSAVIAVMAVLYLAVRQIISWEDINNPGFNAVQLVIPVTLATTFGYSLPSASGRMALIGASGLVTSGEMLKYGIIATIISSVLLVAIFYWFAIMNWI